MPVLELSLVLWPECPPAPKFLCEPKPHCQCTGIGRWGLWECLGREGGAATNWTGALIKYNLRSSSYFRPPKDTTRSLGPARGPLS